VQMLRTGEETGNLDELADRAAAYYEEEAATTVTRGATLIGPALLLLVAAVIAFFVIRGWLAHFREVEMLIPGR